MSVKCSVYIAASLDGFYSDPARRGHPLFGTIGTEIPLRLLAVTRSDNGFVQFRYAVGSVP